MRSLPATNDYTGLHGLPTPQRRRTPRIPDNPSVRPYVCLSLDPSNRMTAGGLAAESMRCHGVVSICRMQQQYVRMRNL